MKDSQKARTLPPVIAAKRQCLAVCLLALILWLVLCVANCGFAQDPPADATRNTGANAGNITVNFYNFNTLQWSNDQIDAVMSAVTYWGERLQNAGGAKNAVIKVEIDSTGTVGGNTIAQGGSESFPLSPKYPDVAYNKFFTYNPTFFPQGDTVINTQFVANPSANHSMSVLSLHELGHAFGLLGNLYANDNLIDGSSNFIGSNVVSVFGQPLPLWNVGDITPASHPDTIHGVMNAIYGMWDKGTTKTEERPFLSEVELAILKDLGWDIDLQQSFGKSYYQDNTTATNTQGFTGGSSSLSYAVGLHLVSDGNTITQNVDVLSTGFAGAGVRVEGNDNTVIISNGITVAANGEEGIGFLSIWGTGTTLVNNGTISATGTNGTGIHLDTAAKGIHNSGTINAGSGNAVLIKSTVTDGINFMGNSDVTGNIVNGSNTSIDLTFGKLAGSGGIAGTGGDENAVISINGNIGTAINQFSLQVWGGTTTLAKDTTSYFTAGVIGADTHAKSTLIVNGDATFGSLDIKNNGENSATLRGIGTITANSGVTNHGVVAPGDTDKPGTLTINGNFTSAADGAILVRAGDLLQVNGTATVSEGTLLVDVDETFIQNKKYVFLKADTLTVTTPLTDPPSAVANGQLNPNFDITADYEDGSDGTYWFQIIRGSSGENTVGNMVRPHVIIVDNYNGAPFSYVSLGKTPNQREMGRYFDVIDASLSPVRFSDLDLAVYQFDHIDARKTGLVNNVLDELSGSLYGTMNTISFQDTTFLHSTLADVLRRGPVAGSMQIKDNVWGMSYAYKGNMQAETNAGKVRSDLFGLIAGFDRVRNSRTRLGGFLSFGGGEIKGSVSDKTATEELTLGLYYRHDWDNSYILAQAGLGRHNYDTQRYLEVFNRTAASKHHAYLGSLHLEAGKRYMRPFGYWHPFLGVQGIYLTRSSFTETGAGSLNLTAPEEDFYSLRQMFGMRFDSFPIPLYNGETSLGAVSIYGNATWMYEFDMGTRHTEFTAGFTGLPNQTFTVHGNDPNRDWGILGVGVNYDITTKARAFLGYDSIVNRSQVIHAANIGFILQR